MGGIRHQTMPYLPDPDIPKDEVKHSKFWRRKKWKDPCLEKLRKNFDKCNFVCAHPVHEERAAKGEEDEEKFCVEDLWHPDCATPSKHSFRCSHPFSDSHVVFLCDISGSMSDQDGGNSVAEYSWIKSAGHLDNRLGALYSSIHKFIDIRIQKGCSDTVSAITTPPSQSSGAVPARKVTANIDFVRDHLLKITPQGCENYGQGFRDAAKLVDKSQDTVIIFLCDGISRDNGAASTVQQLKDDMADKLCLFCITLGPGAYNNNKTVKDICTAGKGKMVSTLNGNELGSTFTQIAKQMNSGAFGAL